MANLKLTVGPWPVKLVTWAACVTVTCLVQLEIKANGESSKHYKLPWRGGAVSHTLICSH